MAVEGAIGINMLTIVKVGMNTDEVLIIPNGSQIHLRRTRELQHQGSGDRVREQYRVRRNVGKARVFDGGASLKTRTQEI